MGEEQQEATLRNFAEAVWSTLSADRRATLGFVGVATRVSSGRRTFRPRVRFTEPSGKAHRLYLGTFADVTTAAMVADLAAMILGREPLNISRRSYATMSAAPLAKAWAHVIERLSWHVSVATTARLQAVPNPFRQQDRHNAPTSRPSALH